MSKRGCRVRKSVRMYILVVYVYLRDQEILRKDVEEIYNYAMNKDTSPAIWVFAMKSDTDYKMNSVGKEEFNRLFSASKTRIVKFLCESCVASHREIYYKRLKTIGGGGS